MYETKTNKKHTIKGRACTGSAHTLYLYSLGHSRAQIDKQYWRLHCLQYKGSASHWGEGHDVLYRRFSESQHSGPANQSEPIVYLREGLHKNRKSAECSKEKGQSGVE